jgi:hypothetical protein
MPGSSFLPSTFRGDTDRDGEAGFEMGVGVGEGRGGEGEGAGDPGTAGCALGECPPRGGFRASILKTFGSRSYSAQSSSYFLSKSGTSGGSHMVSSSMLFEKPLWVRFAEPVTA